MHDAADMVDLSFALAGRELPRRYRDALAQALAHALPWLADEPGVAVHRLNLVAGAGPRALLSGRTRLTLRLPRGRVDDALALVGQPLRVAGEALVPGTASRRELLAFGTQYAHVVAAEPGSAAEGGDELDFMNQVRAALDRLGIRGRAICGRHQPIEDGPLGGYGLMVDGLEPDEARRLLHQGLGPRRLWGCGVFVPHRSAAAVGATH